MKVGFGIIAYDKFDEVRILADIIKGYDKDYFVIACSNHKDAKKELESYKNVDEVVQGEDLPFSPGMLSTRKNMHWRMRVSSQIQKCNQALVAHKELDYCFFLHSDSWILDKETIPRLIERLKKSKKIFGVRGIGFSLMASEFPLGHIDDMFWVYNRAEVEKTKLFDFDVLEMMPHQMTSHGIFSANLIIKVGLGRILYYGKNYELFFFKNKLLTIPCKNFKFHNHTIPSTYDPNYKLTHTHVGAFPDELGLQLQSFLLRSHNLKGPTIDKFTKKYDMPEEELFTKIKACDEKVKRKLAFHLLTYEMLGWGRNYTKILNFFKKTPLLQKIKTILGAWARWFVIKTYTRERYYDYFYGAKMKEGLNKYYQDTIIDEEVFKKYGHRLWYKDKDKV